MCFPLCRSHILQPLQKNWLHLGAKQRGALGHGHWHNDLLILAKLRVSGLWEQTGEPEGKFHLDYPGVEVDLLLQVGELFQVIFRFKNSVLNILSGI